MTGNAVRALAFYLPQFHPIPENDEWWGKGFTEWTNVVRGKALFPGHYQPHLPSDLGFYDLRLPEVREAQAALAGRHGISGFCYYHYWFNGRRLLERPFDEVLRSGKPKFPFCLCWANENWTRVWNGADREVLMPQTYSPEDDAAHIEHLLTAFRDERYITVDGRPLFLVYRVEHLPDPVRMADGWRRRVRAAGFPDLYLAIVHSRASEADPRACGADAAVEFAPDVRMLPQPMFRRAEWDMIARLYSYLQRLGLLPRAYADHEVYAYRTLVERTLARPDVPYTRFRCVTPSWDNSARRRTGAVIIHDSTPAQYGQWLRAVVRETRATRQGDERLVFINAWNEWAEGNHLEPDARCGLAYLEETAAALADEAAKPVETRSIAVEE